MPNIIQSVLEGDFTLPRLLARNYQKYGDKHTALMKKDMGIWQESSWQDYYGKVKDLSLCLLSLGMQPGDKAAIIGDNDPEWWIAELAVLSGLGIAVGVYPDSVPSEVEYIINHSEARFIFARDQEQCDKIIAIKENLPKVVKVFYWDSKGMWHYKDELLCSFEVAARIGQEYQAANPTIFEENLEKGSTTDISVMCYTSGTTGLPKGVQMNTKAVLLGGLNLLHFSPFNRGDNYLAFLSPAWATEQVLGIASTLYFAAVTCFAEKTETIRTDMREIGPGMVFYGSRQWEAIVSEIEVGILDSTLIKRAFYRAFLPVGYKKAEALFAGKKAGLGWRLLYLLGDFLVFRQIRDYLGLSKLKLAITAGSYLGPDVTRFFRAIGVNICNVYGSTEAVTATVETPTQFKLGSAGKAAPGVEVKISDSGEILIKGDIVFKGYYKNPEATAESLIDGWYQTGDAGYIDEEGYLFYLERLKDMAFMKDGTTFAPTYIESRLKFSLYIKDVMVLGVDQEFIAVLIIVDFDTVGKWAEKQHIVYTTLADLSQKKEVYDLIKKETIEINKSLPEKSRIRRFVNLHKEFDADEGELTRTRKLRRKFMEERYDKIIRGIYNGEASVNLSIEVKYRDGRKSMMETDIIIMDV
ncbi:AMP-binding protein [bacterium]|nr:AMP-binding protein [bacterium]